MINPVTKLVSKKAGGQDSYEVGQDFSEIHRLGFTVQRLTGERHCE